MPTKYYNIARSYGRQTHYWPHTTTTKGNISNDSIRFLLYCLWICKNINGQIVIIQTEFDMLAFNGTLIHMTLTLTGLLKVCTRTQQICGQT